MSEGMYREDSGLQEGQMVLIEGRQLCAVVKEVLPTLVFVQPVGQSGTILCIRNQVRPVGSLQALANQALID